MTLQIGFLIFPDVQQLDLTGPHELMAQLRDADVHLIWKDRSPVRSTSGLAFSPTMTFAETPPLDVLCIPGGLGVNPLLEDAEVLTWISEAAAQARFVTSVCTGSLVLGAAGLLRGKRATTHWLAYDFLSRFGAVPTQGRVVRDGNLITAGGVTAGIDFGLTVLAELSGQAAAERVQLYLEYAPAPPFNAGTPETASPEIVGAVRDTAAASRRARLAILNRIAPLP